MADIRLRQEDLKALDQARQKLNQLMGNLDSLKNDMLQNSSLPEWESLQASAAILNRLLNDISKHLAQHAELLQKIAVHPSTNYPGRTQESLLQNLLRKKLDIQVKNSVDEARETQVANEEGKEKENDEVWTWARDWIGERVAMHVINTQGQYYTAEEKRMGIENVRTGLRRKFDDEGSEDGSENGDDEDDDMEDVGLENTTVTATKDGQVQFGMEEIKGKQRRSDGQSRRLSDIMRYITTGDPVRHYPSDKELAIAGNKSTEYSTMQSFQKSRRP